MIAVQSLHKSFFTPAGEFLPVIQNVEIDIAMGEIFGLIGPSGSGKSTFLRLFNLLEKPDSGSIIVEGKDLTNLSKRDIRLERQKIGMIFQQDHLLSNKTAWDNIALPLQIAGWNKADIPARVDECLEVVGLKDRRDFYPAQLSGGQRQRIGIARALANHPRILLADEPTASLDSDTALDILHCLKGINDRFGVTMIIVSHQLEFVKKLCHRVARLQHGKVAFLSQ